MGGYGIPWEDEYWERYREELERPRKYDGEEKSREEDVVFIDDEVGVLEEEAGRPIEAFDEEDLIEIVSELTGRDALDAKWDERCYGIIYHYEKDYA